MHQKSHNSRPAKLFYLLVGILLGALVVLAIRYFTYNPHATHYHANFAVYIDGQREQFKSPTYYQEVAACNLTDKVLPIQRAHMHDNINDVIHVHDAGVTWNQFFNNIGWSIGLDYIHTQTQLYQNTDTAKVHYILNGKDVTDDINVANTVIGDKDRLLVSYGEESESQLQQQFKTVASTAAKVDSQQDPASCAGSEKVTASERFKHLF